MKNNNTKYWFFTWEANAAQHKLPSKEKLKIFLDRVADYAQFQEEIGEKKGNLHYQGCLELSGPRISKRKLLNTLKDNFKNIGGLTLSKVFSKEAVLAYISKQETRQLSTVDCGSNKIYHKTLFTIITRLMSNFLKDRKVIFVQTQVNLGL